MATRTEQKNNWNSAHYDRIVIQVKKGKRDIVRDHAAGQGESMNAFVIRAIDETIARDNCREGLTDIPTAGEAAPAPADPASETETV